MADTVLRFLVERILIVPATVVALLLLGCFGQVPYWYFTLLRWVVTVVAGLVVLTADADRMRPWAVGIFALIALIFNPWIPFRFSRSVWLFIDTVVAMIFVGGALAFPVIRIEEKDRWEPSPIPPSEVPPEFSVDCERIRKEQERIKNDAERAAKRQSQREV